MLPQNSVVRDKARRDRMKTTPQLTIIALLTQPWGYQPCPPVPPTETASITSGTLIPLVGVSSSTPRAPARADSRPAAVRRVPGTAYGAGC